MLTAFALCLCLACPVFAAGWTTPEKIDEEVDGIFRRSRCTGGSVVVAKDGKIVYARDYGFANVRKRQPVNEQTYFKLSSITKMVSALGVLKLAEEGKLNLDADISAYLGFKIAHPKHPQTPITLRQLMSHTAAVSEGGGYSNIRATLSSMLSADLRRAGNFQAYAPGSKYSYSNFGAGIAGSLMEAVTGVSVNRYMTDNVFSPLGITAAYTASALPDPDNVSSQYNEGKISKSARVYIETPYEDFSSPDTHYRTTVGSVWIKSRDLAKIGMLLCGDGSYGGVRILCPETVQMMRKEQKTLNLSVTGDSPYGLFLEHNDTLVKGKVLYGHQGMSDCAIVNTYFDPDTGFVFVLLDNGCSMKRDNRVSVMARRMLSLLYPVFAGTP